MALDTKFRPRRFEDVIGQEKSVQILRQFVMSGSGFHQSYLFCGGHGSGKTTLGRILARALLCENPQAGDPCDQCHSCRSILERGSHECFFEIDAATNSGKEDVRAITETIQFDTLAGRRRLYLFDECHRLSKDALDALLKPMEENVPGGEDKLLVCIFCTTEPEKMRATIFSRCAPAFSIRQVAPEGIADRLEFVCLQEGIAYERAALVLIAEVVKCHIRDALKAVEGVSMMGRVDLVNVREYLRLNASITYLQIIQALGTDLARALELTQELQQLVSPVTVYERLAELSMLAYRVHLNVGKAPSYWPEQAVKALGDTHGTTLVRFAQVFSSRPSHPTYAMVECDLAQLHFLRQVGVTTGSSAWKTPVVFATVPEAPRTPTPPSHTPAASASDAALTVMISASALPLSGLAGRIEGPPVIAPPQVSAPEAHAPPTTTVLSDGTFVDPRAKKRVSVNGTSRLAMGELPPIDPLEFRKGLHRLVTEFRVDGRASRSAGSP